MAKETEKQKPVKPIKTVTSTEGIIASYMPVTVDNVGIIEGVRKDGTPFSNPNVFRAQLRQVVQKEYPATRVETKMRSNIFAADEFGSGNAYEEKRVAWIPVPKGTSKAEVEKRLAQLSNPTLYRVLDDEPILDSSDDQAIKNGLIDIQDIAENQLAINPETEEPLLFQGRTFFRRVFFSKNWKNDIDNRQHERVSVADAVKADDPSVPRYQVAQ